jgi:hypothetical protein
VGSQVEVRFSCKGAAAAGLKGRAGIRTLQTTDGKQYTEIGYDFDKKAMYADHSNCCGKPNTIIQVRRCMLTASPTLSYR